MRDQLVFFTLNYKTKSLHVALEMSKIYKIKTEKNTLN